MTRNITMANLVELFDKVPFCELSERHNDIGSALVVAVEAPEDAQAVTEALYEAYAGSEVFHLEHYPRTNDENGVVEDYCVLIRRLGYDRDVGWTSSDLPSDPDLRISEDATDLQLDEYGMEVAD